MKIGGKNIGVSEIAILLRRQIVVVGIQTTYLKLFIMMPHSFVKLKSYLYYNIFCRDATYLKQALERTENYITKMLFSL